MLRVVTILMCEYCRSNVVDNNYNLHINQCAKNPENFTICEFCREGMMASHYGRHLKECEKNLANRLNCKYCGQLQMLGRYEYHLHIECLENPPYQQCKKCGERIRINEYRVHLQDLCPKAPKHIILRQKSAGYFDKARPTEFDECSPRVSATPVQSRFMGEGTPQAIKVSWKLLGPGEHPFPKILKYCEELKKRDSNHIEFDLDRLNKVYALKPSAIYVGMDEFEGYVVFSFQEVKAAVLECPIVGNAIYVLKGDWEMLSRLSKAELLNFYTNRVTRLVHSGEWFARLTQLLYTLKKEALYEST